MAVADEGIDRRPGKGERRIVQFRLAVSDWGTLHTVVALADDGTLWRLSEGEWQPFPALPSP